MNAERLVAHFEQISEAPDAIARLRRFILDLAVRGKLVEGVSGHFAQVGNYRKLQNGYAFKSSWFANSGVPLLRNANIGHGEIHWHDVVYLPRDRFSEFSRFSLEEGDIVLALDRPFIVTGTKVARVSAEDLPALLLQRVGRFLEVSAGLNDDFLFIWINSPHFNEQIDPGRSNGVPHISSKQVEAASIFIPPLAEQHRIVAKVDELMALCDHLEAARQQRGQTRERLVAASLLRLNQPSEDPASFRQHAQFALQTLACLTTTPAQIKQLRQTILNLAVRGKLVEQDPEDEDKRARGSLVELAESCSLIPGSWLYVPLACLLAEDTRNGYSRKPDDADDGFPILRISAGTARPDGLVDEGEFKLISGIDEGLASQYSVQRGDLLACRFNGNKAYVGRLSLFVGYSEKQFIYPDKLIRIRLAEWLAEPAFFRWISNSDLVRDEVEDKCATTVGNWGISAGKLKACMFPLPPLAEQHRIVAKVDELMAVCDQLEQQLSQADQQRRRLLEAVLAEALGESLAGRCCAWVENHAAVT